MTRTLRRVREGDLDHLIFYILQSTRFTSAPAIEPAISAKALVDSLAADERGAFLKEPVLPAARVPPAVRDRIAAFLRAIAGDPGRDARLTYFRALTTTVFPDQARRADGLRAEYLRVMRFVYEKEFVAQRAARPADAIAELYRTRGLSTDTAVEAGFLVYDGLGIAQSLEPSAAIRRVLIVGPGLDLAPRTALLDDRPPESYQPWAVHRRAARARPVARRTTSRSWPPTSTRGSSTISGAPRATPPTLTLISEIRDSETVSALGGLPRLFRRGSAAAIGDAEANFGAGPRRRPAQARQASRPRAASCSPPRRSTSSPNVSRGAPFDLVDRHQHPAVFRRCAADAGDEQHRRDDRAWRRVPAQRSRARCSAIYATALGLPFEQSRHVIIANVKGRQRRSSTASSCTEVETLTPNSPPPRQALRPRPRQSSSLDRSTSGGGQLPTPKTVARAA